MFEGLIDILNQAFQNFGLLLINIFFACFNGLISLFLLPFISLLNAGFSLYDSAYAIHLLDIVSSFNTLINNVILPNALWVVNLFPPLTFSVCMLFVGLWFLALNYEISMRIIIRILSFFKNVIPFL